MAYEDDQYRDEEGELLMDPDVQSEPEEEEDWRRERSPTPAIGSGDEDESAKAKPRKRLIKKTTVEASNHYENGEDVEDYGDRRLGKLQWEGDSDGEKRKRKRLLKEGGRKKEKKSKEVEKKFGKGLNSLMPSGKIASSSEGRHSRGDDPEVKEMWDSIAGADSEDDQEGVRTKDDDAFIDDTGLEPNERYASDGDGSAGDAPQAEEGEEEDEIKRLFSSGKKKSKKSERSADEVAMLVEQFMAKLEVAAEEDAELNRQAEPAINKLKMLPMLTEVLSKRQLQQEFLDRGVLSVLKNWLEPLPDGCLPNINVRSALLKILSDLPIDVEQYDRKEQLKRSGLGKVIMFLSKSDEETTSNRKLAKDLVDKWSRPIFQKSTRFEDMRSYDDDRVPYRRPSANKPTSRAAGLQSRDDDLELAGNSRESKSGQPATRLHAAVPEALPLDFVVRPQSKIDPEEIRARSKQLKQDALRIKMNKKLQQLKAPKKKNLQAQKLSVEGRGMVKFL